MVALWTEENVWIDHLLLTLVTLADTTVSAVKTDDCHWVGLISEKRLNGIGYGGEQSALLCIVTHRDLGVQVFCAIGMQGVQSVLRELDIHGVFRRLPFIPCIVGDLRKE